MGIILAMVEAAGLGATLGGAVATVAGVSVEAGIAVGTLAGAGIGAAAYCIDETQGTSARAYC